MNPIEKLKMHTPNLTDENIAKIVALFPDCVTETRDENGNPKTAIDFDLLRQALSGSLVEGAQERYQLNWPGKREALLTANAPIAKTLRPVRAESVDFDRTENLFIEGDNLDALKLLQETYLGKVKMIYIDPPYNTGKDFVYADDFAENTEDYLIRSNQKDEDGNRMEVNNESNGRFHSNWLSMMYPRLKLARNLLADDGVIFISIDDNEQANLKRLCDEVFGERNFVAELVWDKKNSAKGVPPKNMIVNTHEYILCYSKGVNSKLLGDLRTKEGFSNPDNDTRGDWRLSNIKSTIERPKDKFVITDPDTGRAFENFWAFSESSLNKMIAERRIIFPKNDDGLPKQKEYFNEFSNPYIPLKSNLGLFDSQSKTEKQVDKLMGQKVFLYKKPLDLIKKIIQQGSDKNSLILDFFAGSGTTAHAVMQLNAEDGGNRRFICVQLPEKTDKKSEAFKANYKTIAEITKERIRRAADKIRADFGDKLPEGWDDGFRVLKTDTSNMADVYYTPMETIQKMQEMQNARKEQDGQEIQGELELIENIKFDRTPEDLLFQVMLDWGVDLALPIDVKNIMGREVFFVDENALIACFDKNVDNDFIKALTKYQPLRVVFRDDCFKDDSAKINTSQIFQQYSEGTEVKTI
ncbi:site-specific DNA-methyltransferase [Avibacterium paragallinarum]|uniref:site-specific DNA-methyltransferase (adenine-specific) n=1 Tax=Avibacterium paragallinarum TaxID=728 RepID=A0ABU7QP05_AVIPA|nr:site-specific DNA-methyltransferase [Avibacterium paragallinarum]